jgi:hypothetical protein
MTSGLEKDIDKQQMADLLVFLKTELINIYGGFMALLVLMLTD